MGEIEIATGTVRRRRAVRVATSAVSVLFTLLGLAFIVPSLFGLQRFVITGTSMTGTIDRGSIAFEEVVPVSDLEVGDIITYAPPTGATADSMVTHRIVSIHGDVFRTQGDAVPQRDPWRFRMNGSEQARVAFAVPYAGYPLIWLADRSLRILVLGVPAGIITLISLGQVINVLRGRDRSPGVRPESVVPGR